MRRPADLFSELKRRKVYRVGAAYLAVVFAALEGADLVFPTLGLGPGVFNGLVIASLLGFPLAVALAWTFDLTDEGIRRTGPVGDGTPPPSPDRWVRLKAALVGAGFVAVVWLGARLWQPLSPPEDEGVPVEHTLAVLPLADFSAGGDHAYLVDGLHDEILHQLARLPGLRLTSRTSSEFMRGASSEVAAEALGVRYVLEGSVRMDADSVLLTIQLIDALTDAHVWSERIGRTYEVQGLFDLQTALAARVASALGGTLLKDDEVAPDEPPTHSLEAYNEYLRGVYLTNQWDMESWWRSVDHFERALQLDPEFGLAHARLASMLAYLNNYGGVTQGELFPRMRAHAEAAMRYAPDEPRTLLAQMAYVWPQDFNWEEARRIIEQALELSPNHVDALWYLAEWHGVIAGDTERGLEYMQQAARLDPLSPRVPTVRAWVLMNGERFEEALAQFQAVLDMNPTNLEQQLNLVSCLALVGRQDEARALIDGILPQIPAPRPPTLAKHLARAGDTENAWEVLRAAVARKEAGGSAPASAIAVAYAALGDIGQALDWLERSFEEEGGVYYLRAPDFAPLAAEPRFQALWDRVGLHWNHPSLEAVQNGAG